jgi:ubiquinol-cytochrome c reductase cytochrome b subunit
LFLKVDNIAFNPYYVLKDLYGIVIILFIYFLFVFYMPNTLSHPDNFIRANTMVTPQHIVPE